MDQHATTGPTGRSCALDERWPGTGVDLQTARRNRVLNGLGDADLTRLLDDAVETTLDLGMVLYQPGRPVARVHFPLTGVVSLVIDLAGGPTVEAATVGFEGMCGVSVFLGADVPTERATVQVAGRAVALDVAAFERAAAVVDGPLYAVMRRYTQTLFTQLARNVTCNAAHTVQQRAARWLLTTQDRMHSPTFELTQNFLAQMLNVRRAAVNSVARDLSDDGAIHYTRGRITINDRAHLLTRACDCYQILCRQHEQLS